MARRSKETFSREITVVKHGHSESADKDPKYFVVLQSIATIETDNTITVSVKSGSEDLFTEYPLKEKFAVKLTTPQTKLETSEQE